MRRRAATILALAIAACARMKPSSSPADDALVLPGSFSEQTTVADLETRFGRANVRVTDGPDAPDPGVVLFPDDPTRRAYVRFHQTNPLRVLASVSVRDAGSRWRGRGGIHVGSSFAELVARNGRAFRFVGFDADDVGTVRDAWDVGSLAVNGDDKLYFGVDLRLRPPLADIPATAYPVGIESIASDDPRYPRLGELVEVSALVAWSRLDDGR
jgi:hypothetical protein